MAIQYQKVLLDDNTTFVVEIPLAETKACTIVCLIENDDVARSEFVKVLTGLWIKHGNYIYFGKV